MIAAKAKLEKHGEWGPMIEEDLRFSWPTVNKLMIIAKDVRLSNPAPGQDLPTSWTILYELTKLDDKTFEQKLRDGTIHANMRRSDIWPEFTPTRDKPPSHSREPVIDRDDLSLTAQQKLDAVIRQEMRRLGSEFAAKVQAEVRRQIDEIILPDTRSKIKEARRILDRRKGVMDKATFNLIWSALRPGAWTSCGSASM